LNVSVISQSASLTRYDPRPVSVFRSVKFAAEKVMISSPAPPSTSGGCLIYELSMQANLAQIPQAQKFN
jgi:hypothetical protein